MNAGYLRIAVLQQLSEQPCSGYSLVKRLYEQTGWKPSFGSIYPLLERFQKDGVVTVATEGRSKVYTLTARGREVFRREHSTVVQAYASIIEQLRVLAAMGDSDAGVMAGILEHHQRSGVLCRELPEVAALRGEMYRLMAEGKMESHQKQIVPVLKRTTVALRRF